MCAKIIKSAGTKKGANMASIFTRNGVLYIQYILNNRKIQRSTKLKDTKENRSYLKKEVIPALERKLALGITTEDKRIKRFAYAYLKEKEYLKTYEERVRVVDKILAHFGEDTPIDKIKIPQIKSYLRSISNKKSTIQNYKTVLKGIFDIAIEEEIIEKNLVAQIKIKTKEEKTEIIPFSKEEVNMLLDKSEGWFKNFLGISFYTGMRTGEVMALMISDIDLKNGTITVKRSIRNGKITSTKTGNQRVVPILAPAIKFLKSQIEEATKSKRIRLFVGDDYKPLHSAWQLRPKWKKVLRACKIADRRMYNTRHTFIVSMLKSQMVSVLDLAQIIGHSSPEMIYRNYARYIKGEQLKIDRSLDPFADNFADSRNLKRERKA